MVKKYSSIIYHRNEFGQVSYEWEGTSPYTYVYQNLLVELGLEKQEFITLGKYRLRRLERVPWLDGVLFVRDDHYRIWWTLRYHVARLATLIYYRSIATLVVWGLAEHHLGAYPSWKDVYVLRRLIDGVRRFRKADK